MSMQILARVAALSPITNHLFSLLQRKIKGVQTTQSSDTDLRHFCNSASQATSRCITRFRRAQSVQE